MMPVQKTQQLKFLNISFHGSRFSLLTAKFTCTGLKMNCLRKHQPHNNLLRETALLLLTPLLQLQICWCWIPFVEC